MERVRGHRLPQAAMTHATLASLAGCTALALASAGHLVPTQGLCQSLKIAERYQGTMLLASSGDMNEGMQQCSADQPCPNPSAALAAEKYGQRIPVQCAGTMEVMGVKPRTEPHHRQR
jgi:translation initiation factor 2B subunit (eIF-2B alpha/beta/delta family)